MLLPLSDPADLREKAAQYRRYAPLCETITAAKLHEIAVKLETIADDLDAITERLERPEKPKG